MPEETQASPVSTPASEPSYVQSMIGPAVDQPTEPSLAPVTQTQQPTEPKPAEAAPAATEKATEGQTTDIESLIQDFAKETGLDPNDPNQRKTLKRLADKELFIRKLQGDNEALKSGAKPPEGDDGNSELLTEFEQSLNEPPPAQEPSQAPEQKGGTPAAQEQQPAAGQFRDVGSDWKTPADSLKALNEAWQQRDFDKIQEIEVARMVRNFDLHRGPVIMNAVQNLIKQSLDSFAKEHLGDVLPSVRENLARQRDAQAADFARGELRSKAAPDIDTMFAPPADGKTVTFQGKQYPATPLNKILAMNPEILDIRVNHQNPETAQKLTMIQRYRAAYRIYKAEQGRAAVSAETAKTLVDAGKQQAQRAATDSARQGINAGGGAGGAKPQSYAQSLVSGGSDDSIPFSSLF